MYGRVAGRFSPVNNWTLTVRFSLVTSSRQGVFLVARFIPLAFVAAMKNERLIGKGFEMALVKRRAN